MFGVHALHGLFETGSFAYFDQFLYIPSKTLQSLWRPYLVNQLACEQASQCAQMGKGREMRRQACSQAMNQQVFF